MDVTINEVLQYEEFMKTHLTFSSGGFSLYISGFFSADADSLQAMMPLLPESGALPAYLVNNIRECLMGKYLIRLDRKRDRIWINDLVGSYRCYINDTTGVLSQRFQD